MKMPDDFGERLDRLIESLFKLGRIDAATQAALSRASGVKEDAFSHARRKLSFSTTNILLLWENLGVQKKFWNAPASEFRDDPIRVMHYLDGEPPFGPEAASRSGEARAHLGGLLPVPIPITPEVLKLAMMELTIERGDLPEVQRALRRADPPQGRGNDLLWWFTFYDEAREHARDPQNHPSPAALDGDGDRSSSHDQK